MITLPPPPVSQMGDHIGGHDALSYYGQGFWKSDQRNERAE